LAFGTTTIMALSANVETSFAAVAAVRRRRSVYDLEESINGYGHTIYVEEWQDEEARRPKIWYEFNRQGILLGTRIAC